MAVAPDGSDSKYKVSLPDGRGTLIGDHGQQTNIFQVFADAAPGVAAASRWHELAPLMAGRTRGLVAREFVSTSIRDLLQRPEFPPGYVVIRGEPGIGKTAFLGEVVNRYDYVHHFNVAAQNIRSAR